MTTPRPRPDRPSTGGGPGVRVLIAEDDPLLNPVLAEAVREAGWEPLQAFDGLAAVDLARKAQPAVIVLDLNLPRLYGHLILRSLRRDPSTAQMRVVILTAHAELLSPADRAAADAILRKPAGLERILAAIRGLLPAS
jgi:DNA-binding response OmpR family regulator